MAARSKSDKALDDVTAAVLDKLGGAGYLPRGRSHSFPEEAYYRFESEVRERLTVPTTTMTNLACRVCFGLSAARAPRTVLGLGTFVGYAVTWIFGPALDTAGLYQADRLVACEIDPDCSAQAEANFRRLPGGERVEAVAADAAAYLRSVDWPIELLFIDVDSEKDAKASYAPLLEKARPKLAPGALVLAHDITHPWFAKDMVPYRALVADRSRFRSSATLEIDPCGLEVTLV